MSPIEKKSLSIGADTHKKIAHESIETGRDMWELVAEAWKLYEAKAAKQPPPGLTERDLVICDIVLNPRDDLEKVVASAAGSCAIIRESAAEVSQNSTAPKSPKKS